MQLREDAMQWKICVTVVAATLAASIGSAAAHPRAVLDAANLRQGPGHRWPVIAVIPGEAQVDVLNCGPGWHRAWCHVRYENFKGYVAASTLAPSAFGGSVIVAPLVTRDSANVRKGPGTHWATIATIPPETQVDSTGCISGWHGDWCRVHFEGRTGYVHESLLDRRGALFTP
jgi:uncharacterized protein YraI